MSKSLKILEYLLLVTAGFAALFFVGFCGFLTLMSINDQASYSGDTVDIGPIDYNSVITKAEKAGYGLSGPYTRMDKANLIEPGNIEFLEKRFKTGYKISRIALYYNLNTYLEFRKDEKNQTLVTLYNYSHHDNAGDITPQMPSMFPEDPWMLKMLGMGLGLNEIDSGEFLKKLKNEASNKKGFVSLTTKENVDFPAVYTYLNQSKKTTFIGTEDKFYRNDTKLGCVGFVIPETIITRKYNSNKYNIYVNSTGIIRIDIMMPTGSAGKKIPEEEYRIVFREMFENVGLPAKKLDEIELNYTPSIW